jgi:endogenous inhibitor of DNA gyrase (YacG/DUF329 family)
MSDASCEWCGVSFLRRHPRQRFCSDRCGNAKRNQRWAAARPEARRAADRRYREANREKVREANRRYVQENPDRVLDSNRRYRATNPEKQRAHILVGTAVRRGKLARPDACERCGTTDLVLHGHHRDYSQPLDVEWLCPTCHRAVHMEMAA